MVVAEEENDGGENFDLFCDGCGFLNEHDDNCPKLVQANGDPLIQEEAYSIENIETINEKLVQADAIESNDDINFDTMIQDEAYSFENIETKNDSNGVTRTLEMIERNVFSTNAKKN